MLSQESSTISNNLHFFDPKIPGIQQLIDEVHWELVKLLAEGDSIRLHFLRSLSAANENTPATLLTKAKCLCTAVTDEEIYNEMVEQVRQLDAPRKLQLIDHVAEILKNHGANAMSLEIFPCFLYNLWRLAPQASVGQEIALALEGIISL